MQLVYFVSRCTAVTHPYKWIIVKLQKKFSQTKVRDMRASPCSFLLAMEHKFSMWGWKLLLWSKATPSSFSLLLLLMAILSTLMVLIFVSFNTKWHLSGFSFILLSLYHSISDFVISSNDFTISQVYNSSSTKDKSHIKILNKSGPNVESWGSP